MAARKNRTFDHDTGIVHYAARRRYENYFWRPCDGNLVYNQTDKPLVLTCLLCYSDPLNKER